MKIAIIGASLGQVELCKKAKEAGIKTVCFAWEEGAVCKNLVDVFYPISITDISAIERICEQENFDGFVSNGSEKTLDAVAELSQKFGKHGVSTDVIKCVRNKLKVRQISDSIEDLSHIKYMLYEGETPKFYPCVVKPCTGAGKIGVSFCKNESDFETAIEYAKPVEQNGILIEEFVSGREISVESISYEGKHFVLQITDKDNTGAPHFVEIGHHQPANLNEKLKNKIKNVIPKLLNAVGYINGASHVELKISDNDEIYLIEINCRGGGDEISNKLVQLSTGYDYVKGMIEVALGTFKEPVITKKSYSGIYFLCKQTEHLKKFFLENFDEDWLIERHISDFDLKESTGNRNRNGYIIYSSDKKIII